MCYRGDENSTYTIKRCQLEDSIAAERAGAYTKDDRVPAITRMFQVRRAAFVMRKDGAATGGQGFTTRIGRESNIKFTGFY